ncbi:MAG: hypothetical protein HQL16_01765 [Candidatus Omnitrophica bacterium]|nr:hypothetical protein [Candidatus Omnitrophota bacterium]
MIAQKKIGLSVVAPDRILYQGEVQYISVPGSAGYMGVLPDHTSLVSTLQPGRFEIRPGVGVPVIVFSTKKAGLFEINKNKAAILLDSVDSGAI